MKANPLQKSFQVRDVTVGGDRLTVIAGPCAVEDAVSLREVAAAVKAAGATILRGGAFKPRTSPRSFQGLGDEGLKILGEVAREFDLPVVTEVLDPRHIEKVSEVADMLQIGSRNMHSYSLLAEVGRAGKPVFLKRGMSATEKEFLLAADYLLEAGEERIVLCERGVRGVNEYTRNMFDLGVIPALRSRTPLPIFADPSHATGRSELVPAMSRAAVAAGADGLIIEVHPDPTRALCDGQQALLPETFRQLMESLRAYAELEGKILAGNPLEVTP